MLRILTLSLIVSSAVAADVGYVAKMIACEENEEALISNTYDAFIELKAKRRLKKEELGFPARLAIRNEAGVIFSRAFYVSPNELRGFEIFVPKGCFVEKDGIIISSTDLVVQREETRQGITCLVLRKIKPNKAPEPTPTAASFR